MIRVVIADDSPTARGLLRYILSRDPEIEVVGMAVDGEDLLRQLEHLSVDVVVLDVVMPRLDGYETSRRILARRRLPILLVTASWKAGAVGTTFRAMEVGAVMAIGKPPGPGHPGHVQAAAEMIEVVKQLHRAKPARSKFLRRIDQGPETRPVTESQVTRLPVSSPSGESAVTWLPTAMPVDDSKLTRLPMARPSGESRVTRLPAARQSTESRVTRLPAARPSGESQVTRLPAASRPVAQEISVLAIGASTGGPPALQTMLLRLGADVPVPILVVQHISAGFVAGMADWLRQTTRLDVCVACHGERPRPGCVYLAPDGAHMGLAADGTIRLSLDPPRRSLRPSVSWLFESVGKVHGKRVAAVLLTGMGSDGAAEMKTLRDLGAVTFAQDQESSVIFGMPGRAVELDAAAHVLSPDGIADALARVLGMTTKNAK